MTMHYTLTFKPGTETAITGSKAELVAELRNLIDEIYRTMSRMFSGLCRCTTWTESTI